MSPRGEAVRTDVSGFRTAGPADASAVRALTREAYAAWVPVIGREPMPMTADYAQALRAHRIELLERGGALAGLIELVSHPGHLMIENVAVGSRYRGQGLGRLLMTRAEDLAPAMGHRRIRLYTHAKMRANVAIYTRLGYRETHRVVEAGFDRIYMLKDLAQN